VDPLFRSAARTFGPGAVGVMLSGVLDDGTAGLLAIKGRGGVAIVQDPEEATHPGMPLSAIENVDVDHVLPVAEIASLLTELAASPIPREAVAVSDRLDYEAEMPRAPMRPWT